MDPVYVKIRDFQSIKNVEMEVRGFTCLVGKSNIGKSAIIRAVSSALLNKPVTNMVRHGAKDAFVSLKSSNWGLEWTKAERGSNEYKVGGKTLKGVGQGQLEDVAAMGFGSVRIGDQEIHPWLAHQWKPVFLLDVAGTAVTEFISGVSRLKVLQDAVGMSLKERRRCLDKSKLKREELTKLQAKQAKLADADMLEEIHTQLEQQVASIRSYGERLQIGCRLHEEILDTQSSIDRLHQAAKVKIPAASLDERLERLQSMTSTHKKLRIGADGVMSLLKVKNVEVPEPPTKELTALESVHEYARVGPLKQSIAAMEGVSDVAIPDLDGIGPDMERLRHMRDVLWTSLQHAAQRVIPLRDVADVKVPDDDMGDDMKRLYVTRELLTESRKTTKSIAAVEVEKKALDDRLKELQTELSKIPLCPTCDQPLAS